MARKKKSFYAVYSIDGKVISKIYTDWNQVKKMVNKHESVYKGFYTEEAAQEYLDTKNEKAPLLQYLAEKHPEPEIEPEENISEDYDIATLNEDQKRAFDLLISEDNVFLSGQAGTGKSYVLNCYLKFIEKSKNVIITAPSGVAAINVGGVTMHSAFQIPFHPILPTDRIKVPKIIKEADIIVIDEISMCRCDVFDYIGRIIKRAEQTEKKKIKLIVVGDFFQLPPVINKRDRKIKEGTEEIDLFEKYYNSVSGFAYESKMWEAFSFKSYVLTKVIRQTDQAFIKHLNMVREGDKKGLSWLNTSSQVKEVDGIYLCPRNDTATRINTEELGNIPGKSIAFKAVVEGKVTSSDKVNDDVINLKVGADVVFLINDQRKRYQNGSFGVIEEIDGKTIKVKLKTGKYVEIEPYTWEIENYVLETDDKGNNVLKKETIGKFTQIPIKLAYATTIHKSQGQTYDAVNVDPSCFAHGQLYVALSRVRNIHGLHLKRKMSESDLVVDKSVNNFYSNLICENADMEFSLDSIEYEDVKVPKAILANVMEMVREYEKMFS